ncbi:MAG: restriction endonuclease subunit R, partial [Gammaproteobacteria bacterium]|nr:restriction endonuclease subunit R [Gammaproteobacteria bacterium]
KVLKEEFGKGNEFCRKITSKTTGASPEDLLSRFRNSYNPRIAVTVDMIATGTDVKPLECLLFLRNVNSAGYFEQMKGRGVRVIEPGDLRKVTPDAEHKTHFVIVDAVGVCERDKTVSPPLERRPSVSLEKLLQMAAMGMAHADLVSSLASRLARLGRRVDESQAARIAREADGTSLTALTDALLTSIDPEGTHTTAVERFGLAGDDPTPEQLDAVERERMAEALKPFTEPRLRRAIIEIAQSLDQLIDEAAIDVLLDFGHSEAAVESARSKLDDFQRFIEENKDEIEALRILYSRPYRAGLRYRHVKELRDALRNPPVGIHDPASGLWRLYEALEPDKVAGRGGNALVDLVAIVRHAINPGGPLVPVAEQVDARYREWLAEKERSGQTFTPAQRKWLDAIKDHIASSLRIEPDDFEDVPFNQWGGLGGVYRAFGDDLNPLLADLNERLVA